MSITLNLPPSVEAELRLRAAEVGVPPGQFAARLIADHVGDDPGRRVTDDAEAGLIRTVYAARLPARERRRQRALLGRLRDEELTPEEHQELLALNAESERLRAMWLTALLTLATRRGVSPDEVKRQLGIRTPTPL